MLSLDKKYKTVGGHQVVLYNIVDTGMYPVHGAIFDGDEWDVCAWSLEGEFFSGGGDPKDLVEIKRNKKHLKTIPELMTEFPNTYFNDRGWLCLSPDLCIASQHLHHFGEPVDKVPSYFVRECPSSFIAKKEVD